MQDFHRNFLNDPKVKIPWVRRDLCGKRVLVMEWIDGVRCTDPAAIRASGLDLQEFIRCGVVTGMKQLLEVGHLPCLSSFGGWREGGGGDVVDLNGLGMWVSFAVRDVVVCAQVSLRTSGGA